ncbi:hypothetical protein D2E62_06465 [Mycobacteroides abscessus]|nr:hypothetical protein D2E62_06465 [Mycobacteroides abscessus]
MTGAVEASRIAARLASSPWFPLSSSGSGDGRAVPDSTVHVESEGDVVTVTVTDADGAKREYRAQVQLASSVRPVDGISMRTAPVIPDAPTSGGSRCNQPLSESR